MKHTRIDFGADPDDPAPIVELFLMDACLEQDQVPVERFDQFPRKSF